MKDLKNLIKLSSKVEIIIPSTFNVDQIIDNNKYVNSTLELFSKLFGGATASDCIGCWFSNDKNKIVKEKNVTVFSYCNQSDLEANIETIINHCEFLKNDMKQEAISLLVNNELYFI